MTSTASHMLPLFFLVYLHNGLSGEINSGVDWCSIKCEGVVSNHTMCQYKAGGAAQCAGARYGLSSGEQQFILDYHNELRDQVARGLVKPQPSASDMKELAWDDELSQVAQRWIEQCQLPLGHDQCRDASDGTYVGQNVDMVYRKEATPDRTADLKQAVKQWFDEFKDFDKNKISKFNMGADFLKIGHYSQLVWAKTDRVGCGAYEEKKGELIELRLACNYKPTGNVPGDPIYTVGPPASKCAGKSQKYEGLCSS